MIDRRLSSCGNRISRRACSPLVSGNVTVRGFREQGNTPVGGPGCKVDPVGLLVRRNGLRDTLGVVDQHRRDRQVLRI